MLSICCDRYDRLDYEEFRAFLKDNSKQFPQLEMMAAELLAGLTPDSTLTLVFIILMSFLVFLVNVLIGSI